MKRLVLLILLLLESACALGGEGPKGDHGMNERVISGTISLPEISGALPVGSRLLVAADDPDSPEGFNMIALLENAVPRLESGQQITVEQNEQIYHELLTILLRESDPGAASELIADLEDLAVSPEGDIFLISSHSRNKRNKTKIERQRLVRLRVDRENGQIQGASFDMNRSLLKYLPEVLAKSTERRPGEMVDGKYDPGFNIEGLAWAPEKDLFIGLRSPTLESRAIVLRLHNANDFFDKPNAPVALSIEARLDLGGLGIRGLCFDQERSGYWIIAGLSPDPDQSDPNPPSNEWSIWFWNKKAQETNWELETVHLPPGIGLNSPEAVSIVRREDDKKAEYLLLISDDGGGKPSSYALIPLGLATFE